MPKTKTRRNAAIRADLASRANTADYRRKHSDLRERASLPNLGDSPAARPNRAILAPAEPVQPYGFTGTRRHGNKRGSDTKGQGEWRTVSPSYRTVSTHDARWSA